MPLTIARQDISKMNVDAIVNAANTDLQMGGGVCGTVFREAGERELQEACDKVPPSKRKGPESWIRHCIEGKSIKFPSTKYRVLAKHVNAVARTLFYFAVVHLTPTMEILPPCLFLLNIPSDLPPGSPKHWQEPTRFGQMPC